MTDLPEIVQESLSTHVSGVDTLATHEQWQHEIVHGHLSGQLEFF